MVEFVLLFSLGFLSAALLALMTWPMLRRRTEARTRKRLEATLPMSLDQVAADKDRLRAEFAMAARRLEMRNEAADETAARHAIEAGRLREDIKRAEAEREESRRLLVAEQASAGDLRTQLTAREDDMILLSEKRVADGAELASLKVEIDRLGLLFQEASYASSNRQIELVARDSDIERLQAELGDLKRLGEDNTKRIDYLRAELAQANEALGTEKKRAGVASRDLERAILTIAERDRQSAWREGKIEELSNALKNEAASVQEIGLRLSAAHGENRLNQDRIADMEKKSKQQAAGATIAQAKMESDDLASERARLKERLALMVRQNQKLRSELALLRNAAAEPIDANDPDASLRAQISEIAAQVVHMTRSLEGPGSPIDRALGLAAPGQSGRKGKGQSLADRVRALQAAAKPPLN